MAQSSHHATQPSKETVSALSDLAFAEILAKRLASLSAEQEAANSRLGILSCLAAEALKEDFPESTDEAPASSELSWEEDTDDLMDEDEDGDDDDDDDDAEHTCPRFKVCVSRASSDAGMTDDRAPIERREGAGAHPNPAQKDGGICMLRI
uniref:Legionella secretion system protein B n=1 Tax=Ganoderma boninense TaxID=34458 RepID=A0A5K1K2C0_9APHY|nr:Legionella secretion system protein B [Ganoderma boninense]